jgi:hypothetical protein
MGAVHRVLLALVVVRGHAPRELQSSQSGCGMYAARATYQQSLDISSSILTATADPYDASAFSWLANCPATDCYDGDVSTTATMSCGSNLTNLCHTGYVDQVRLRLQLRGSAAQRRSAKPS